jgi:hypothetical protein
MRTPVSINAVGVTDNDLLTERQAQQELPMSLAWFRRRRVFGDGPPFLRVSNRVFYRRGALRSWIEARGGHS